MEETPDPVPAPPSTSRRSRKRKQKQGIGLAPEKKTITVSEVILYNNNICLFTYRKKSTKMETSLKKHFK